jgi:hypothetical protein
MGQNFLMIYTNATPTNTRRAGRQTKSRVDSAGAAGANGDWVAASAIRPGYLQNHQHTIYGGDEKQVFQFRVIILISKGIFTGYRFY